MNTTQHAPDRGALPPSPMRHGQYVRDTELQTIALGALQASGRTQKDIAEELGVTKGAVSQAIRSNHPRVMDLRIRIIELLTPYRCERGYTRILRKDNQDAGSTPAREQEA